MTETVPLPDLIFTDGFESSDFSAWLSHTNDQDLSVSAAAALFGGYGRQVTINDNVSLCVTDNAPASEKRYRARFYFDPNSVNMDLSDTHDIFLGIQNSMVDPIVLRLQLKKGMVVCTYQVQVALMKDNGSWSAFTWVPFLDNLHAFEIDWQAATAAEANDGRITLWLDSVQKASLSGLDIDTTRIDTVRMGAVNGIDTGTCGTYYFDAFVSRRLTYIGLEGRGAFSEAAEMEGLEALLETEWISTTFAITTTGVGVTTTFPITDTLDYSQAFDDPYLDLSPSPPETQESILFGPQLSII